MYLIFFKYFFFQPCDATLIVAQGLQILEELQGFIPGHLHTQIQNIQIMETHQDVLIFTAEDLGKFSAKFYKKLNRQDGVKRSWAHWIWHRTLPSNISALLWKVIRHAIVGLERRALLWLRGAIVAARMRKKQLFTYS